MKVFYHVDMDGRACGAILIRRFPEAEAFLYNYWYSDNYLLDKIGMNEKVVFADIVPRGSLLKQVLEKTRDIVLIDHHITSYNEVKALGCSYDGKLAVDGPGACLLTWEYCYPEYPIPQSIKCIADYDIWERNELNQQFHFGIQTFDTYPKNPIWDSVLVDDTEVFNAILFKGKNILDYLKPWYRKILKSYSFEGTICKELTDGAEYSCLVVNQGGIDGTIFDEVEKKYDIHVRVVLGKNDKWLCSILTDRDDIDVSKIAEKLDGGGHQKVGGFSVTSLNDFFVRSEIC